MVARQPTRGGTRAGAIAHAGGVPCPPPPSAARMRAMVRPGGGCSRRREGRGGRRGRRKREGGVGTYPRTTARRAVGRPAAVPAHPGPPACQGYRRRRRRSVGAAPPLALGGRCSAATTSASARRGGRTLFFFFFFFFSHPSRHVGTRHCGKKKKKKKSGLGMDNRPTESFLTHQPNDGTISPHVLES